VEQHAVSVEDSDEVDASETPRSDADSNTKKKGALQRLGARVRKLVDNVVHHKKAATAGSVEVPTAEPRDST